MQAREPTTDLGVSYTYRAPWGTLKAEFVHDALNVNKGDELRLGYSYDWKSGRWHLRPALNLMLRSARLNDYYYGVRADEATANRPAYMPGAGTDAWLGVYGYYDLSRGWRILGGLGVNLLDSDVRRSPIVRDGNRPTVFLGAAYDFGSYHRAFEEHEPLIVKLLYGKSTDCNLNRTITLRCASTDTVDNRASPGWRSAGHSSRACMAGRSISSVMSACCITTRTACRRMPGRQMPISRRSTTVFRGARGSGRGSASGWAFHSRGACPTSRRATWRDGSGTRPGYSITSIRVSTSASGI
jgi:hypothetical protein